MLGEYPNRVDLDAKVIFSIEENGLVRERVTFDCEERMSVPCVVLRPVDMPKGKRGAAILCSYGHGGFERESVAGECHHAEESYEYRDA